MNYSDFRPKIISEKTLFLLWVGFVAGIFSALVKSGFETIFPPDTINSPPPPLVLLSKLGFNVSSMTYSWLDYTINWGEDCVHLLFSVILAMVYCISVELIRRVRFLHGIFFGVFVSVFAHGLILPLSGLSGWIWLGGFKVLFSEFIGTAFWIWTIECIRKKMLLDNKN